MRKWVRTSARMALLTAGFVALGAGVSFADSHPKTTGNGSLVSGNQLVANLDLPVNATGNAIGAVGGVAGARADDSGAAVIDHGGDGPHTSGNGSALSGNQAVIDGDVPLNVSGNAVGAVLGTAGAAAHGTGSAVVEGGGKHHHGHGDHGDNGHDGHHRAHQAAPTAENEDQAPGSGLLDVANLGRPVHISPHSIAAGPILHQTEGKNSGGAGQQEAPQQDQTRSTSNELPAASGVIGQVVKELPLRNELPDPVGSLPLTKEVPGTQAAENQAPAAAPKPADAAPAELSGLPGAAPGQAGGSAGSGASEGAGLLGGSGGLLGESLETDLGVL